MVDITGAQTGAILTINAAATAWDTAVAASTGDTCQASFTPGTSVTPLTSSPIGTGKQMDTDTVHGALEHGLTLAGEASFQSGLDRVMAQFFGTSGAPTEQTPTEGDYLHRMTFNSTWNANYCTYAVESSSTTVLEYPSVVFTSLSLSSSSVKSFVNWSASAIASSFEDATATNTNATIDAATIADSEKMVVSTTDEFQINAQGGGALSGSDQLDVTDYSIELTKPQETAKEIRDTAGNGEPVATDLIGATLTVTLRKNDDNTHHTAWEAETEYKCLFKTSGTQIGAGLNKSLTVFVPKMKLIEFPSYSVTDAGTNPKTLVFKILGADSNPTGMDDILPYVEIINGRAGAYIT